MSQRDVIKPGCCLMCESWDGFKNGKCIACNHDEKTADEIIKQRRREYLGEV